MATCYNHVIHARNRPWGKAQGRAGTRRPWAGFGWPLTTWLCSGLRSSGANNQRKHESSPVTRAQARAPLVNIGTLCRARDKPFTA